jgi:hypothetical protein
MYLLIIAVREGMPAMLSLPMPIAVALVRLWTRLYTWRLPGDVRDARRAEIESDLWEFQHDNERVPTVGSAAHLIARVIRGVPDDLSWRADHMRGGGRAVAARFAIVTIAVAASGTMLLLFDLMRARELPKPPPHRASVPAPTPAPRPPALER